MLVALLSDVQSNAAALRAVLDAIDERHPDYVFALGDFVGRGPAPRDVLKILHGRAIARTRGTWDVRVAGVEEITEESEESKWVKAARRMLRPRQFEELASPPESRQLTLGGRSFTIAQKPVPEIEKVLGPEARDTEILRALRAVEAEVIAIGGGTAFVRRVDGHLLVSSGSVGQPNAGDPRASFVLVDVAPDREPTAEIVRVPYALRKNVRAMRIAQRKKLVTSRMTNDYFKAQLEGAGRDRPERLAPNDAGSALLVKLLAHRTHQVYAAAARDWPEDSVELVHDLRVATRRLREALAVIRPLVGKKRWARMDRRAQKLGRALGERRIADVMIELHKTKHAEHFEKVPAVSELLIARRDRATDRFFRRYSKSKLLRHGVGVLGLAMDPKDEMTTLGQIAPAHIEARTQRAENLLAHIDTPDAKRNHHRLRIALKHARYSAEIFAEVYPSLILTEEVIAPLRKIQDALGDLNDAEELLLMIQRHHAKNGGDEALEQLIKRLEAHAKQRYESARDLVHASAPRVLERLRAAAQAIRAV
jgi:CHAD domain-containing protein